MIISEVMEQLLSQLGESLSVGEMGELGEGGGEELPREVVQVSSRRKQKSNKIVFGCR